VNQAALDIFGLRSDDIIGTTLAGLLDDGSTAALQDTLHPEGGADETVSGEYTVQRADDIDLVLLDVVMPGLGGRKVHDRIRELRPDVRVAFMSGYSTDDLSTRFVLEEGLELISKPIRPRELLSRLRELLDA
jgi:DNA-binding response OmpR family regulator